MTAPANKLRTLPHGYQAVFARDGIEYTKCFWFRECGGKRKAAAAARQWLANHPERYTDHYAPNRFYRPGGAGHGNPVQRGVNEGIKRRHGHEYGCFQVFYVDDSGRRRNKSFQYGNLQDYDEGRRLDQKRAATAFRERYEQAIRDNADFDERAGA